MTFWKRAALVYVFLTLAFIGIAEGMKINGGASPHNSVWIFISTVRNAFLYTWVLLLAGAVILFLFGVVVEVRERRQKMIEAKEQEERRKQEAIEREWKWIEEERKRLENRAKEYERERQELRASYEEQIRDLKARQARTTEDAAHAALGDFG